LAFPWNRIREMESRAPRIGKDSKMRTLFAFALIAGICAATVDAAPAAAAQRCRMEKQCRWVNFKKICTYVRVCRDY
jgi:hypothetical protein